jgi:hypothetical protein
LVDEWIRDGATKAQTARQRWPFFLVEWAFNTAASTASYTFTTIEAGESPDTIAEITRIRGPNWPLRYQPMRVRDDVNQTVGSETTGPSKYWSVWPDGTVVLDPIPTGIETMTVFGYREPRDWVSDGVAATSDMPKDFDSVILNWATGRAYAQQDEPQTSLYYLDLANLRLQEMALWYDDPMPLDNVVLNGGWRRSGLRDPRFVWE